MRYPHSPLLLLALVLSGCDASSAPEQSAAPPPSPAATHAAAAPPQLNPVPADPLAGLTCKDTPAGWARSCTAPGFDVSGSFDACTGDSISLGAIHTDGPVPATDRLIDGRTIAKLAPGQFICIQFNADPVGGAGAGKVYVTAIAPSSIPACTTHACGDAKAVSRWTAGSSAPCRIDAGRYGAGCVAGWVSTADVDAFSMGLGGEHAEGASGAATADMSQTDFTEYARSPMGGGQCVVGAEVDDLGRQKAAARGIGPGGQHRWAVVVPLDADYHQNRATHCACTAEACYIAVATDTQPARSLSQTLLSVVRIAPRTGTVIGTQAIERIPGASGSASAWLPTGPANFTVRDRVIAMQGQWRADADERARPFRHEVPLF